MTPDSTPTIQIDFTLYGDIAPKAGGTFVAQKEMELPIGTTIGDLLDLLEIADTDRGYLFVNSVLYDVPGLSASRKELLKDKDHVGIFSTRHMWPYQYRDGVRMSESLKATLAEVGAMHNSYQNL
jgi:hypothetical protein